METVIENLQRQLHLRWEIAAFIEWQHTPDIEEDLEEARIKMKIADLFHDKTHL